LQWWGGNGAPKRRHDAASAKMRSLWLSCVPYAHQDTVRVGACWQAVEAMDPDFVDMCSPGALTRRCSPTPKRCCLQALLRQSPSVVISAPLLAWGVTHPGQGIGGRIVSWRSSIVVCVRSRRSRYIGDVIRCQPKTPVWIQLLLAEWRRRSDNDFESLVVSVNVVISRQKTRVDDSTGF
jgi:hypothetical protein